VPGPEYELTAHAKTVLEERGIQLDWLARVLASPERSEPDRTDPELRHAIGRIAENDDRYLRVIYNATVTPWRIVTAYFDRGLRTGQ
jgi:hypothetical protein